MPRIALLVDDSLLVRHTVARYLEERGFIVACAHNGHEALKLVSQRAPSVILTDLDMPQMTGEELIKELRARPQTAKTPIIVLTGKGRCDLPRSGTAADGVVYKDINLVKQLDKAISRLM